MDKNLTLGYAGIQCFFWMGFAAISGFASVFLLDAGFTNTQIGIIIAAAGSVSALLQPVAATVAESGRRFGLKELLCIAGVLVLLMGAGLAALSMAGGPALLTGGLYGGCLLLLQLALPLVNAAGTQAINQGRRLNWGAARGAGSVAYAAGAWVLGILAAALGVVWVPVLIALSFGLLTAAVLAFPFGPGSAEPAAGGAGNPSAFFAKYPRFGLLLVGAALLYTGHMTLNSYLFQIVQSKGGGSAEMGAATALSAFWELPTMFLFSWMVQKVRCDVWMRVSGFFFLLKAGFSWLAPNVAVFYAVQVFQMLGWGLISVASVYYINAVMEAEDAIKGQAYFTMTFTLGSVLGALIGGGMLDWRGVGALLGFAFVATLLGERILYVAVKRLGAVESV